PQPSQCGPVRPPRCISPEKLKQISVGTLALMPINSHIQLLPRQNLGTSVGPLVRLVNHSREWYCKISSGTARNLHWTRSSPLPQRQPGSPSTGIRNEIATHPSLRRAGCHT